MNTPLKLPLLLLNLSILSWSFLPNSYAEDAEIAIWPADVISWRTHHGNTYEFSKTPPNRKGQACYRTVFFGDSICAGFDNQNPFNIVRSFCENMAIRFSAENNDIITKYENFSKVGATADEILKVIKKHQSSIKKAHLIVWESGGNDMLMGRQAFRDKTKKNSYCRQCLLDNELGNPFATGPDPRCKDTVGILQNYKSVQKETISFIKENADSFAIIRAMGLYYPQVQEDRVPDLNCTDPDTKQTYVSAYPIFLPIITKTIFSTLDSIAKQRAEGDLRFNTFESFPQFNSESPASALPIHYFPGESLEHYFTEKILPREEFFTDPYFQTFSFENGTPKTIMQTRAGTKNKSDVHPSEAGHILIQQLNSMISYLYPFPSTTNSALDCN